MPTATRPSVFVSYNQADRAWAEWIAWVLEENGYTAVIQAWDIRPGSNFVLEMHKAAEATDRTVLVLSDHYLRSDFTQPEWAAAFARDPRGRERKLIPVRVAVCSPGGLLAQIVWTDLVGLAEPAARERLLQAFAERGKPLHAPAFPGGPAAPPAGGRSAVPFPGNPPVHNLPYPRLGDLFTGRQDELDALAGGGTAAITQSAVISGLGGIGKTRLAVEYAWRSGNRYTAAWFVRADSPENLRRNLAALAGPVLLNLPEWEEKNEDKTVAAVQRSLRESPWLADDPRQRRHPRSGRRRPGDPPLLIFKAASSSPRGWRAGPPPWGSGRWALLLTRRRFTSCSTAPPRDGPRRPTTTRR
ncbi:MAG TPA: hypothetical protein DD490_08820 [Acidobacteria bacterium]|nr:hypothetical protein [Acidobacteriota bacterium]